MRLLRLARWVEIAPSADRTAAMGPEDFLSLGDHVLAGRLSTKSPRYRNKLIGSGGRILSWKSLRLKEILIR